MYRSIILLVIFTVGLSAKAQTNISFQKEDTEIFNRLVSYAGEEKNIIHIARFFLDAPYTGNTLEGDSIEQLTVNLRELDCVTLVENVVALYQTLNTTGHTFDNFCRNLRNIRYRDGILNGYLSRLHYTSEWLDNNYQKGIIDLPEVAFCREFSPSVSFMSANCDKYPPLKNHPEWCSGMKNIEKNINQLRFCYIPKEKVKESDADIRNGDIIAITTHIKGLDISHVGFAVVQDGLVYLLHASSASKKVVVSKETLHKYLEKNKNHSGIIVARIATQTF